MNKRIATTVAAGMLAFAASAAAVTTDLGTLGAPGDTFSRVFFRAGDDIGTPLGLFTDTYTFSLASSADVTGDLSIFSSGRAVLSLGSLVLSGGSLAASTEDLSPASFGFAGLDAGTYSLEVNGRFSGLAGTARYEGQLSATTVSAVPEPTSAALLLAGTLLLWVRHRTLRSAKL